MCIQQSQKMPFLASCLVYRETWVQALCTWILCCKILGKYVWCSSDSFCSFIFWCVFTVIMCKWLIETVILSFHLLAIERRFRKTGDMQMWASKENVEPWLGLHWCEIFKTCCCSHGVNALFLWIFIHWVCPKNPMCCFW